jgi:GT2 family glycosyltransferase
MRGRQSGYIKNIKYFKPTTIIPQSMNERDRLRIYGKISPVVKAVVKAVVKPVTNKTIEVNQPFSLSRSIPKRMFFYWGGSDMSWMRYMTLYSFRKMNPDWEVILYISDNDQKEKGWKSEENQDYHQYKGDNYINKLKDLNIEIKKVEFPLELRDKLKDISPIHESDLFRYYQLYLNGGFYCDMDVLFFRPIDDFYNTIIDGGYDTVIHEYESKYDWTMTIGFLGACVNNEFYKNLFEFGVNSYINKDNFSKNYQSMGIKLIYKMFLGEKFPCKLYDEIVFKYSSLKFYNLPTTLIYKFDWTKIQYCFTNSIKINDFNYDSIGYHWYGAGVESQEHNNILTEKNYKNYKTTFSTIADEVINMKIDKNSYVILNEERIKQSIIISYKESGKDRRINLQRLLEYLSQLLDAKTEIVLVEQGNESKINWINKIKNHEQINHIFIKNDKIFNKGYGYNVGAKNAKGNYLIFNDVDLFLELKLYSLLISKLDQFDIINPYKYLCFLDKNDSDLFISDNYKFTIANDEQYIIPSVISGGIFMMKKENFLALKGFDEDCYGYGHEDDIFDTKIRKLKQSIYNDDSTAIHIYHKGITNEDNYYSYMKENKVLFDNYLIMTEKQLNEKIENTKSFGDVNNKNINKNNNKKKYKISIVTAYVNRKQLFYQTLKSIEKSKFKDFELIVVDDCSLPEHRLEEYLIEFPFLKIIRLEPENRWYINSSIPYNFGIRAAVGDIIILQNPECLHVHDVLTYVNENLDDTKLITMSTYALNPEQTIELPKYCDNNTVVEFLKTLPQITADPPKAGWYNHTIYRPAYYHFCSAITKVNMEKLNGFDERYAYGIGYEDNEFIERVKRMGLKMIITDDISVIHQYHSTVYYVMPKFEELGEKNKNLFNNVTKLENKYRVN